MPLIPVPQSRQGYVEKEGKEERKMFAMSWGLSLGPGLKRDPASIPYEFPQSDPLVLSTPPHDLHMPPFSLPALFPPGIFKIEDSAQVARLWGVRKNRPAMNYDKLSRSIRQYYKKGIIRKPDISQRLVYQFVHPV